MRMNTPGRSGKISGWRYGLKASLLLAVAGSPFAAWPSEGYGRPVQPPHEPPVEEIVADEPAPGSEQPEEAAKAAQPGAGAADLASEEALARFQQLLQRRPFHGPAFNGLVNHAIERGKLSDLIVEYQGRAAALPDDVALRIILARLHLRADDAAAAVPLLDGLDRLTGDMAKMNAELLVLKSEVYQRTGDNGAAERMLKEAQGLAGSVSERLRLGEALADLYLRSNQRDQAVAALESLAAEFPENYVHQKHVAGALAQRGLHEAAAARYRAMLPLVKDEVDRRCEVLRELGQSLERLEKRDEAIAAYVEAVGLLNSDHWLQRELHERIVGLYRAANRLEDLVTYCTAQIARAPDQTGMRILLADVQSAMGSPEKARLTLEEAVGLFPKDLALSQKRVEFLERLGDLEGVSAEYQRIIGQHPNDVELYVAYGQGLANNRQIEAARGQWRHVLNTKVDDPALAIRLGGLFESYELYEDAAEAYERAVTINPRQPDAYTALSRLWLAQGDGEKAAAMLDRMGAANPNDGAVQAALASELRNLGKTEEALAAITKASELLPEQARYHVIRSELLVESGRLEEALEIRRAAIDRLTNPVQQTEAIGTLVSMYESADKLADLKQREEEREKAQQGGKVSLLMLAKIADVERDFPAMRRHLDALLGVDPGNEAALQQLAKLQDATGDIDAAVATYTQLIQRYPARSRHFYEAIVDLKLRYQDRAGAIETLERMAKNDPANAATQSGVAEQLVRMDEPERALPYFEKGLQIQADRHESRLDYGKALADAGRLEEAMAAFRAVATQRADTDRAVEALGRLHDTASQLGRLEELIDELEHQVETDPSNTLVASALARLLVHELEYGRAIELLDLVLRNNPRDIDLALARAEVLRRLARFDEAVAAYQKVLRAPQIDRDYVQGELGKTYFESGQVDQARRVWRQIQHKLYSGSLLKNNGLLEESISVLEEGIRLKPDEYALHRNLIGALEAAGRTPDALAAAKRLLDLEPGNVWNIERLADAYMRDGDRAGAAAVAGRLFSAAVSPDKPGAQGGGRYQSFASAMYASSVGQYGGSYGGGGQRSNLERGIEFFTRNGLRAELETVLAEQIAAQPDNAMLKETASDLYTFQLNKPELALSLLRELETAAFPVEHQSWLGQCSQQDYMRIRQYNLIASKPVLRDRELTALEAKKAEDLTRDDLLALAVIRKSQGNTEQAAEVLGRAVKGNADDALAMGILTELLVGSEKFAEAEPHARRLVELLAKRREQMHAETVERVRRDFVRSLPLEFQLRVTESLLSDIAEKWTLGEGWSWWDTGTTQAMGYLRAKLTLGTICAETGRMDEARGVWKDLAPKSGPDVDRWTMLGDTAQLHKQEDLAFDFYQSALRAAKQLSGDGLLQQVYASSTTQRSWYGEEGVDKAFSNIVEAFAKRDNLVELYDFLRDTDQEKRARRVAEQYKLSDALKTLYTTRFSEAAAAFKGAPEGAFRASTSYFATACKLAELYDREGDWDRAQAVYESYLKDFPDELGLLTLMGEVAEARLETGEAIEWEKKVLDCKERLARRAREWSLRDLAITPSIPQVLGAGRQDMWSWASRWGRNRWNYGGNRNEMDRSLSWMRLAELHLAGDNTIAAADAMQQAVAEAGSRRDDVVRQVMNLIQQRQLTKKMLPVLRSLAVYAPADERVQLGFAEALEAADRKDLALEVCNRMLRRGVSDLGVLAELRRRVQSLNPENAAPEVTLATLEAEAVADPGNLKARLRLAKACFYSLEVGRAEEMLVALAREAPHLEDVHDLLVEVYTLRGDSEKLIAALTAQIERLSDERERRTARWRLVDELLAAGRTDEALAIVKELGDPRDPRSYVRIGTLLHYFGKSEEAIACLEEGGKSRSSNRWDNAGADFSVAQSLALRADFGGAADKIMSAVDEQSRQQTQQGGMYAMYDTGTNPFASLEPLFALFPDLVTEVSKRLEARREAAPGDPQVLKLLMGLKKSLGRPDQAEALLEQVAQEGAADQAIVIQQIDRAVRRREFARAVELAQKFIAEAPKPQVPPGMPAQYAGYAVLQSPRTLMLCKLGDVLWEMGEKDEAFKAYQQIVDKKVDETNVAYATICLLRGRGDEAKTLIDGALAGQEVKPAGLLQFRAFIALLDGESERAFDLLAEAAVPGGEEEDRYMYGGGGGSPIYSLAMLAQRAALLERFAAFVQERIKKNPNDWENYQVLASAYWQAGRPSDAMKVLDQTEGVASLAQQALAHRLEWREAQAPSAELIPMYEQLIEMAEKEVRTDPNNRWGGYDMSESPGQHYRDQLAELHWNAGEKEQAERLWTERMNAQLATTHIRLGQLYLGKQVYEKAEEAFKRAIELDPENTTAHMALAEEAFQRGDRRAMLTHMHECFVRRPSGDEAPNRYRYDDSEETGEPGRMYRWALALAEDPALSSYLADAGDDAGEYRIMLATLSGDWAALEAELKPLIEGGATDPLLWKLWAKVQQRKGAWNETAVALDFLRRVKLTSIGDHRERLKLVLAGKQLKEAVAGTRQAQPGVPATPAQGAYGSYGGYGGYGGYYGYSDWWEDSSSTTLLPSIYIKLGDFKRAERLYLISSGGDGVEGRLPWLASLMWQQQAKERALELMRLALATPSDRSGGARHVLPQYAAMLAESGQAPGATDLLVRTYRYDSSSEDGGMNAYAYMYGYAGAGQEFEQGYEVNVALSLHSILTKSESFAPTLERLAAEAAAQPDDPRLAKLVVSLQKQGRLWEQQRDSLAARRVSRPSDTALTLEQFHAECQLGRWDAALALVAELRTQDPKSQDRWNTHEAFVHVMRKDSKKAVAAIEPLLKRVQSEMDYYGPPRAAGPTVLAATGELEQLGAYLQERRNDGELDASGKKLLARVMLARGQWNDALLLALEEFWRQQQVLGAGDRWWSEVARIVRTAELAGAQAAVPAANTADAALLTLLKDGPSAGMAAFERLVGDAEPTVEALRGMVLAATLAGDERLAVRTNERLIASLAGRRSEAWYQPPVSSIQRQARAMVDQMARGGMAQVALGGGLSQAVSGVLGGRSTGGGVVTFETLWQAHSEHHRSLLARVGEADALLTLLKEQARTIQGQGYSNYDYDYGGYMGGYQGGYGQRGGLDASDMPAFVRHMLWSSGRLDVLRSEYNRAGTRVPTTEWSSQAEGEAAAGEQGAATALRARAAALQLAQLHAVDRPDLGGGDSNPWNWYWYYGAGSMNQEVAAIRHALQVGTKKETAPDTTAALHGEPDQLWEFAMIDPAIEQALLRSAESVGPGWGSTQTVQNLVAYHQAKEQPDRVIELIERTSDTDQILRSPQLAPYVWACYKTRSMDRIEALLAKAQLAGATLQNEIAIARLVALRLTGDDARADEIEAKLLERAVVEVPSPLQPNPAFLDSPWGDERAANWQGQSQSYNYANYYYNSDQQSQFQIGELAYAHELASALRVRFDPRTGEEDITVGTIRGAYERHALHTHAARLLEREIAQASGVSQRFDLLQTKADTLHRSGNKGEALRTAGELEKALRDELVKSPACSAPIQWRLARLLSSPAAGPDYARAYEALVAARKADPACDEAGIEAVHCLYELGRHREAWQAWQAAIRNSRSEAFQEPTIYYAALSGCRSGEKDAGLAVARQALYKYPLSPLAKETRELIDAKE